MEHSRVDRTQAARILFHMEHNTLSSVKLGLVMKRLLHANNISQNQLAILTGIPRNTLNRKINGGVFDFDELTKIASVLKKKLSSIIALAEEQDS